MLNLFSLSRKPEPQPTTEEAPCPPTIANSVSQDVTLHFFSTEDVSLVISKLTTPNEFASFSSSRCKRVEVLSLLSLSGSAKKFLPRLQERDCTFRFHPQVVSSKSSFLSSNSKRAHTKRAVDSRQEGLQLHLLHRSWQEINVAFHNNAISQGPEMRGCECCIHLSKKKILHTVPTQSFQLKHFFTYAHIHVPTLCFMRKSHE
jgi:hypothetical protein